MLGHRVRIYFMDGETVNGELRLQSAEGVWLYHGCAEQHGCAQQAAVHFYPSHRIKEIADLGEVYR